MTEGDRWTEQETRTRLITPAITAAGWDTHTQVREDVALTAGRIDNYGRTRQRAKRADYVLSYRPNIPLAVIEAKDRQHQPGAGMQQALQYAAMLDAPFVFSTNGQEFLFHDKTSVDGPVEKLIAPTELPGPEELRRRYREWKGLSSQAAQLTEQAYYADGGERKGLRYYQAVAVNRVVEAVAAGQRRLLLVMATGTGKTLTAFQIIWRLRESGVAKRVLFLVDRNVLADQAFVNDFSPFGQVMTKVANREVDKSYEVYLALYQALTGAEATDQIYRQFSPDFFDMVVIDECHRGSAAEDSAWRAILEYFGGAIQLGLTATPKETKTVSNLEYFSDPVYTYSLKNGIDDGFLAPFEVRRIDLDRDLGGWRPTLGQRDRFGKEVPDRIYTGRDYDRTVVLGRRSPIVAESITKFMKAHDRYAKTIVFCEDIDHAERMRQELVNANHDIASTNDRYVVRITGDSEYGAADLDSFMDPYSPYPVIVTTSKLLTTGVDIPTCKVIVLDQTINSLTEFKQIIGRGTRVREDLGKTTFTILDYRGATQLFADPEFDGDPERITTGAASGEHDQAEIESETHDGKSGEDDVEEQSRQREESARRKFYVDGVEVSVLNERVQFFDRNGRLITETIREFTKNQVLKKFESRENFVSTWLATERKTSLLSELANYGVMASALEREIGSSYDPFDLLLHVAYGDAPKTRAARADAARDIAHDTSYSEIARAALAGLLQVYVSSGPAAMEDNYTLKFHPLSEIGTPVEIIRAFGGRQKYEDAVRRLQRSIYSPDPKLEQ